MIEDPHLDWIDIARRALKAEDEAARLKALICNAMQPEAGR